ncbi:MAG: glucose-6-phosphate isomerase family protein [Candidatus Nealsonbacteria bacterium]|nr:glucose-6-phosphate isomerase family protein [Candidatus Nealsonbacteria bacterium]
MAVKSNIKPDIRFLNDMKKMLYDKKWAEKSPNYELYYMYRGIKKKPGLRYDITVIPPRMLGKEFVKTKGHEHLKKYGEVYIVLSGQALYLMQKQQKNKIEDVYAVKAKKGEVVVVPPYYGHITINPSKTKTLKEANWVSEKCRNIYDLFVKKDGACYYYTKNGWLKNKKYAKTPKLRFQKSLKEIPENLDFLYGN